MDQSKTNIPHIVNNPKVMAGAYRLETHITGVKVHGRFTMMFIDSGQFNHDTNLTGSFITSILSFEGKNSINI